MRFTIVLLATLIATGCGAGNGKAADPVKLAVPPAPPSITALSPVSVPANSPPFTMTINGSNFGTDALVFWHNVPQQTTVITSKQIIFSVTADDLTDVGLVPIFVRSGGLNSNAVDFDVTIQ